MGLSGLDREQTRRPPLFFSAEFQTGAPASEAPEFAVSVIARTRDRPILLRRACASVLNQTFSDWQMLIVNDGGKPEEVEEVVAPLRGLFGKRLEVIHHPKSLGMEAASNAGIRASSSEFIVIHDDDDSWHPDFLSEAVEFLRADAGGIYGGVVTHTTVVQEEITPDGARVLDRRAFNSALTTIQLDRILNGNTFPPISFLFRRSAATQIGLFNPDLPVLGDWEFNLRMLLNWEIGVIPKPLAYYHHRPASSAAYGNTVIAGASQHMRYESMIRNQVLRRALKEQPAIAGLLLNRMSLVSQIEQVSAQIVLISARMEELHGWSEKLTRPLRRTWRYLKPLKHRTVAFLKRAVS